MLAVQATDFSLADRDLASGLAAVVGDEGDAASYALIAKILQDDRVVTPDADLTALVAALEREERSANANIVKVQVQRDCNGGAGYSFDRETLKITGRPRDSAKMREMRVGDVIVAVNGQPVSSCADYRNLAHGVRRFELTLRRAAASNPPRAAPWASQMAAPGRQIPRADWQAMSMDIDSMSYEQLLAWEEQQGRVVRPGLSEEALDRLPVEHVCGGGHEECGICLEDVCDGELLIRLPCLHQFHASCCRNWLRRQAKCPFCNLEVPK